MAAEKIVFDASAILAMVRGEPGWDRVLAVLPDGVMSTVNAAEVYSKLEDWKIGKEDRRKYHAIIDRMVQPFDTDLALRTGALRRITHGTGLSLGDRACIALAQRLGLPAMTADREWAGLEMGVPIEVIR